MHPGFITMLVLKLTFKLKFPCYSVKCAFKHSMKFLKAQKIKILINLVDHFNRALTYNLCIMQLTAF